VVVGRGMRVTVTHSNVPKIMYWDPSSSANTQGSRMVVGGTREAPREAGSMGTVSGDVHGPTGELPFTTATCRPGEMNPSHPRVGVEQEGE
jgi:hypothetical protein